MQHILITGGSGLLGSSLTEALISSGYQVSHLSRNADKNKGIKTFLWDVSAGSIDENCLEGVDIIVHLAGAGIADKRWTAKRKKLLTDSRIKSIELIYDLMKRRSHKVKSVISASATGYYSNRGDTIVTENDTPASNFLGQCCELWEKAVDEGAQLGLRIVKYRTGVVLDKRGGALPILAKPIKFGFGTILATGKQWIPWIHWQDAVDMYLFAISNEQINGVFNMVAPKPVTNHQLTVAVAEQLHRPLWLPKAPAWALQLAMGEMSRVVLDSTRASAAKIESTGFVFKFPVITEALRNIYG